MKITPHSSSAFVTLLLAMGIFSILSIASPVVAGSASALDADANGWVNLMPAADLKGWTRIAIPPTNALGRAQWHLDAPRQVLICDGDGGHEMLRFDRELTNVIFHVECRFVPVTVKKKKIGKPVITKACIFPCTVRVCRFFSIFMEIDRHFFSKWRNFYGSDVRSS